MVKNLPANAGDAASVPRLARSSGEGNGNPLLYLGVLGSPMDREAWCVIVHEVAEKSIHNLAIEHAHTVLKLALLSFSRKKELLHLLDQ